MIKKLLFLYKRGLFTYVALCLCSMPVFAQQSNNSYFIPKIFPNAPNTAALGKYGNYPVSLVNGLPDISIPLYEIQAGDFKVPITLSYHASGIKVTEIASWAGLGWSVNAGGAITRRIMGNADESDNGYLSGKLKLASDIDPNKHEDFEYLINVKKGYFDTQPDIFSYNFPGKSGKFFFNGLDGYKPIPIPLSPVKISKKQVGNNLSFNLVDDNGNLFNFGSLYKEFTTSYSGGENSVSAVSAWMLESMISQNRRDTVSFSYTSTVTNTATDVVSRVVLEDNFTRYIPGVSMPSLPMETNMLSSASILEQKIDTIKFRNGRVIFKTSTNDRLDATHNGMKNLEIIEIYSYDHLSKQFKPIKTIRFYQSYFIQGGDLNSRRLRLDSLALSDGTGKTIEKYRFNYNTNTVLPANNSYARDYWGYYNGKKNTSLIPQMQVDYISGAGGSTGSSTITIGSEIPNSREPDSTYMQACMLQRIYFPAGGYADFEFETNRYKDQGKTKLAGGLRVKSIKSYDGINAMPLVKTYQYTSARPNFFISNFYFQVAQTFYRWESGGPRLEESRRVRTFLSNPTIDIEPYDATPVIYPTVTEYLGDGITNNGKIEYTYTDASDAQNTTQLTGKPITDSFFFRRGQLTNAMTFANTSASYQKVKQEESSYFAFPQKWHYNVGLVVGKRTVHEGVSADIAPDSGRGFDDATQWVYTNYSIITGDQYLTSKVERTYDTKDFTQSITSSTEYKYDNSTHQQVTRIRAIDSKGNIKVTTHKYAADFLRPNATSTGYTILDNMLANNMLATLVEKWDSLKTTTGNYVTDAQLNLYKSAANGALVLDTQKKLQLDKPLSDFQLSTIAIGAVKADARYSEEINFDSYDNNNNLIQYSLKAAPPISILWGYNKSYPIAEVKNAQNKFTSYSTPAILSKTIICLPGNFQQQTITFTTVNEGTIDLHAYFGGNPGTGEADANFDYFLSGPANRRGSLTLCASSPCMGYSNSEAFTDMPAGNYTLTITIMSNTATSSVYIGCSYPGTQAVTSGLVEFYYEGFEDDRNASTIKAHTGNKCNYDRAFTVNFTMPNSRSYKIGWHQFENDQWVYKLEDYSGSKSFGGSSIIDDIRVFPSDAQMTTYTYDPLFGMTSSTDANNITTNYEYDAFGRLKLIKDDKDKVIKQLDYKYVGQD
jgi:YD repeat-containing protein